MRCTRMQKMQERCEHARNTDANRTMQTRSARTAARAFRACCAERCRRAMQRTPPAAARRRTRTLNDAVSYADLSAVRVARAEIQHLLPLHACARRADSRLILTWVRERNTPGPCRCVAHTASIYGLLKMRLAPETERAEERRAGAWSERSRYAPRCIRSAAHCKYVMECVAALLSVRVRVCVGCSEAKMEVHNVQLHSAALRGGGRWRWRYKQLLSSALGVGRGETSDCAQKCTLTCSA